MELHQTDQPTKRQKTVPDTEGPGDASVRRWVVPSESNSNSLHCEVIDKYFESCRPAIIPEVRTEKEIISLCEEVDTNVFFQQKKGGMMCGLYAIWNYIGRSDCVTAEDMKNQVVVMENKEWLKQRKGLQMLFDHHHHVMLFDVATFYFYYLLSSYKKYT